MPRSKQHATLHRATYAVANAGAYVRLARAVPKRGVNVCKGSCVTNALSEYDGAELCER